MNKNLWSLLLGVAVFSGCVLPSDDNGVDQTIVQSELSKKTRGYRLKLIRKCRQKGYDDAIIYTDSIVSTMIDLSIDDTTNVPSPPKRPVLKTPIVLDDSTKIGKLEQDD